MSPSRTVLPRLHLASKSPRRQEILRGLGVPFKIVTSIYQERAEDVAHLPPSAQAVRLAELKAGAVTPEVKAGIVIGSDTVVVLDAQVLGKPRDRNDARGMLEALSGKCHEVMTGLAVCDRDRNRVFTHCEVTRVFFRQLGPDDISSYLDTDEPYDKAGAYAIQGMASLFIPRIEGCYFNVVGFPVVAFARLLEQAGVGLADYLKGEAK